MVTISETLSDTYCHLLLDAIFKTWENFQCAHQAELSMHASDRSIYEKLQIMETTQPIKVVVVDVLFVSPCTCDKHRSCPCERSSDMHPRQKLESTKFWNETWSKSIKMYSAAGATKNKRTGS